MPWNNQNGRGGWQGGGGGGRGQGPWGQRPGSGGGGSNGGGGGNGNQPPDLEEILRRGQDRFKKAMPGGGKGGGGLGAGAVVLLLLVGAAVWGASGFHVVDTDEVGVVTRFGEYVRTESPGLNYALPWPIENVEKPKVTQQRSVSLGGSANRRDEGIMLTGDENIVDVDYTVLWMIRDPVDYLFNVQDQEATVRAVAESAMREISAQRPLNAMLNERGEIELAVRVLMQETLDSYGAGVTVNEVQMQNANPPAEVIEAFRDVQAARQDQQRFRNEAEAYANRIVPEARGQAAQMLEQAEAYKEQTVAEATGDAERFLAIYNQYVKAQDVTKRRMYLETMERILARMNKVLIDGNAGGAAGSGVVPYLPLPEVQRQTERRRENGTAASNDLRQGPQGQQMMSQGGQR